MEIRLQDILTYIMNDKIVGSTHKVAKIVFEGVVNMAGNTNIIKEKEENITIVPVGD